MKKPLDSNSNEYDIDSYAYLEKPKKKKLFQKILSGIGFGGVAIGGWIVMVIQFILYGSIAVLGLGVVISGISLIADGRIWSGLGTIFILAPIVVSLGYFILNFVLGIIFAIIFGIGSGGYYLVKGIGRLLKITKIVKVKSKIANKEETKEEIPYINKDAKTEIELQQETDRKLSTVEPFIDLLKNGDEHDKKIAAEVLGEIGVQCAVEPLIEVLREVLNNPEKEEGYETGTCAARALGKIGDSRAVEPLIDALRDKGMTMRLNAAIALGEIGDKRAVEPLIEALQDKSIIGVDHAAAEALGKIGDSRALEPLKKAFIEYSFKVEAIDKITKKMKRKQEP